MQSRDISKAGIIFMQLLRNPRRAVQVFPNDKKLNLGINYFMQLSGKDYGQKLPRRIVVILVAMVLCETPRPSHPNSPPCVSEKNLWHIFGSELSNMVFGQRGLGGNRNGSWRRGF